MYYYISRIQKIHTVIRITSKIQLFHPFTFSDISWKFHQNLSISFFATMYTNTSGNLDPDDPDSDPDHSPNLITCSSHHLGHLLKMSSQSIHNFLRYLSYYISWIQKIHIVIRITSKIQPFHPFTFSDISWKFHQNPSISFFATMYTNTSGSLDPDDPDSDPDHSPNLITCSSQHLGHLLKMSSQSIHNFLRYLSYYISWIQKIHIVIRITSKIQPFHPFTFSDISWKFHQNPSISFLATMYTNTSATWIQMIQITPQI